jgi:hypothetical protein
MKTLILSLFCLAVGSSLMAATAIRVKTGFIPARPLQLIVQMPTNKNLLWNNNVAQEFATFVESEFQMDGFRGQLIYLNRPDPSPTNARRLEIKLTDWNRIVPGTIDCTFTARLVTPAGSLDLGRISGTADDVTAWFDPVVRTRGIVNAATNAADHLYRELTTQKLL